MAGEVWEARRVCREGGLGRLRRIVDGWAGVGQVGRGGRGELSGLLLLCARLGKGPLAGFLLARGADANVRDEESGRCALHFAALSGSLETVRCLLENGADKLARCKAGCLAQDLALSVGNHRIAQVLGAWVSAWDLVRERQKRVADAQSVAAPAGTDIETLESVLQQKEELFGAEHAGLVPSLEKVAAELTRRGDVERALEMQARAASLADTCCGQGARSEDEALAACNLPAFESYFKLGDICIRAGSFERGEAAFRAALRHLGPEGRVAGSDDAEGEDNAVAPGYYMPHKVQVARGLAPQRRALERLAQCLEAQQRYAEEERALVQVVRLVQRETADPDHPSLVFPLTLLGRVRLAQGLADQARATLAAALAVADKHLGPNHLDIAVCLDNLAAAFLETELHAEAEALFRRALAIREALLHPVRDRSALRTSENNIAMAVVARGEAAQPRRRPRRGARKSDPITSH